MVAVRSGSGSVCTYHTESEYCGAAGVGCFEMPCVMLESLLLLSKYITIKRGSFITMLAHFFLDETAMFYF